jgi:type I restriction enzyme S subunit
MNYNKLFNYEECIDRVPYTNKIKKKKYLEFGDYPIISQEQDFINGYWNDPKDLFRVDRPVILFGDHTRILKYVDFDFVLGADGTKIIKPKDFIIPKFFYYALLASPLKSLGYARHSKLLKNLNFYIPDLVIQKEIIANFDLITAQVDEAVELQSQKLKVLQDLKISLLNKTFKAKKDE